MFLVKILQNFKVISSSELKKIIAGFFHKILVNHDKNQMKHSEIKAKF